MLYCHNMTSVILIILGVLILILLAVLLIINLRAQNGSQGEKEYVLEDLKSKLERSNELGAEHKRAFEILQGQMTNLKNELKSEVNDFAKQVDTKLHESHKNTQFQFTESQKLIKDITGELEQVKETNKQVFSVTEQLQSLEKVLTHQKQRGIFGEVALANTLSNILPPSLFSLQYRFENGETVDAIIKLDDKIIPVDAKFSLDNYTRVMNAQSEAERESLEKDFKNDLKKRIDETAKYIRPEEGTLPFAFMYIPAEGIYYDLLVNEVGAVKVNTRNLIDYAYTEKKVIIVSPTTFNAYLLSVLNGYKAFQIQEQYMQIGKRVQELQKHILAYEEYYKKLGNTLGTTVSHYNNGYKELKKIDKDVVRIAGKDGERSIEPELLEKPMAEE